MVDQFDFDSASSSGSSEAQEMASGGENQPAPRPVINVVTQEDGDDTDDEVENEPASRPNINVPMPNYDSDSDYGEGAIALPLDHDQDQADNNDNYVFNVSASLAFSGGLLRTAAAVGNDAVDVENQAATSSGYVRKRSVENDTFPSLPTRPQQNLRLDREMNVTCFVAICNKCRNGRQAVTKCAECMKYLCTRCTIHHTRSDHTANHALLDWYTPAWSASFAKRPPRPHNYFQQVQAHAGHSTLPLQSRIVGAERRSSGERPSYNPGPDYQRDQPGPSTSYWPEPASNSRYFLRTQLLSSQFDDEFDDMSPCLKHGEHFIYYCPECIVPLCPACLEESDTHKSHGITTLVEGMQLITEKTQSMNGELIQLSRSILSNLDAMQYRCDEIDYRAHEEAVTVKAAFLKLKRALEYREARHLSALNQARVTKLSIVYRQMDVLQDHYKKLCDVLEKLDNPRYYDFMGILAINREAQSVIWASEKVSSIGPLETASFTFEPPEHELAVALSKAGKLTVDTSTMYRSPALSSNPSLYATYPVSLPRDAVPAAMSRGIHGCDQVVAVTNYGTSPHLMFGQVGHNDGELCRPWGITINRFGHLLVADRSNNRIQVLSMTGVPIWSFGSLGTGKGQFDRPSAVAVNPMDDIVVADKDNHRIQIFNRYGKFLHSFGEKGTNVGQFQYPWDVACDKQGRIVVSDVRNRRVQLFHWNGVFITSFGANDLYMPRVMDSPRGVTFDPSGNILMTDFNLHRVLILNPNTGEAKWVGGEGSVRGCFNRPQGIYCDDRGWFVVADSKNYRCQVFNHNGHLKWTLGTAGKRYPGELDRPSSVCLDANGHIFVMDFGNTRIQIY